MPIAFMQHVLHILLVHEAVDWRLHELAQRIFPFDKNCCRSTVDWVAEKSAVEGRGWTGNGKEGI